MGLRDRLRDAATNVCRGGQDEPALARRAASIGAVIGDTLADNVSAGAAIGLTALTAAAIAGQTLIGLPGDEGEYATFHDGPVRGR